MLLAATLYAMAVITSYTNIIVISKFETRQDIVASLSTRMPSLYLSLYLFSS